MPLVYATQAELSAYAPAGVTVPGEPEATRLLTAASKEIRRATKTAIYDVDEDGYPTDTAIRQAFRDATCAQAIWRPGDPLPGAETGGEYSSVSIGSVTLSRGAKSAAAAGSPSWLAEQADTELRDAGILPGHIIPTQT